MAKIDELKARMAEIRADLSGGNHYSMEQLRSFETELQGLSMDIEDAEKREKSLKICDEINRGLTSGYKIHRMGEEKMDIELRASTEYKTAFFNALQGKANTEQRALVTTATGAAVIPETTFNEVVANLQKSQGLLGHVRVLDIPGKLSIPQADIQTAAAWHVEGDPIADSSVPPTNVSLTGFELAKLFSMSAATQAMAIPSFEKYLIEELTRTTRDALADAVFNGVGVTQPTGIEAGFVWGVTNSLAWTDAWTSLNDAMALLAPNFLQGAVYAMSSTTFYKYVSTATDANGAPIFTKYLTEKAPMSILGKPIVLDDYCPANTIFLCDPKYYFLNFSSPMAIERSSEAGFTTATVMYRSLAVVDGKPVAPAFIKITGVN